MIHITPGTTTDQSLSDTVVRLLEVGHQLLYNSLGICVVTHGIEEVDGTHTDTDITFTLGGRGREGEGGKERGKGERKI